MNSLLLSFRFLGFISPEILLALTITINFSIVLFLVGVVLLFGAILLGFENNLSKGLAIGGLLLVFGGYFVGGGGFTPPTPGPVPGPVDPVDPIPPGPLPPAPTPGSFAAGVQQSFKDDGGTTDDIAILAPMFLQYSYTMAYDGKKQQPRIVSNKNFEDSFARIQEYYWLQLPTPMDTRFPKMSIYISAEMGRIGLKGPGAFDDTKRGNAVLLFQSVSDALRGI